MPQPFVTFVLHTQASSFCSAAFCSLYRPPCTLAVKICDPDLCVRCVYIFIYFVLYQFYWGEHPLDYIHCASKAFPSFLEAYVDLRALHFPFWRTVCLR